MLEHKLLVTLALSFSPGLHGNEPTRAEEKQNQVTSKDVHFISVSDEGAQ